MMKRRSLSLLLTAALLLSLTLPCAYAEEDICRAVKAVGTDAFQAGEYTGADEPQSCRIKEDIMTLVRESL